MRPFLHHLKPIPVSVPRSIVLLRGQSSSACFPPANRPVERSKFFFAVRPAAVARPNKTYKQKLMANADAKRQDPQYTWSPTVVVVPSARTLECVRQRRLAAVAVPSAGTPACGRQRMSLQTPNFLRF